MGFFTSVPSVAVTEVEQKMQGESTILIDVRNPDEYSSGHARGAVNYPLPQIAHYIDKLKGYSEVYVICQSGGRSATATSALIKAGISAVNVTGGTSAWRAHGLPVA